MWSSDCVKTKETKYNTFKINKVLIRFWMLSTIDKYKIKRVISSIIEEINENCISRVIVRKADKKWQAPVTSSSFGFGLSFRQIF